MIFIVNPENRAHFAAELRTMHRHRKQVFIDALGWNIAASGDEERDRYDGANALYLLAKDRSDGELLASARLLPTEQAHLLGDLFAHACECAVPTGAHIWEASRFCASPLVAAPRRPILLLEVICGILETALLFGVHTITLTANSALLPVVLKCGWAAQVLGQMLPDGDDSITAVAASVSPEGLMRVRQRLRSHQPVTRFLAPPLRIAA